MCLELYQNQVFLAINLQKINLVKRRGLVELAGTALVTCEYARESPRDLNQQEKASCFAHALNGDSSDYSKCHLVSLV